MFSLCVDQQQANYTTGKTADKTPARRVSLQTAVKQNKQQTRQLFISQEEEFYKLRPANKTDHLCQEPSLFLFTKES